MKSLCFGIDYWSKGTMKTFFIKYEGVLGCLGAFVQSEPIVMHDANILEFRNQIPNKFY